MTAPLETREALAGVGGTRRFRARWVIEADLVAQQLVHLGSGENGADVDLLVTRDAVSGGPLLTGDSLAGGLREYLCLRLIGARIPESSSAIAANNVRIAELLGGVRGDSNGDQSNLIAFDSWSATDGTELRYGNRHDPITGLVDEHALYSLEAWPSGTTFPVRIDLQVPETADDQTERNWLALLALATEGFADGRIRLGAKGRRGFGRAAIRRVRVKRFALDSRAGWESWLAVGGERLLAGASTDSETLIKALTGEWDISGALEDLRTKHPMAEVRIQLPVKFEHGLQIGSPVANPASGADRQHLMSGADDVISGTALAGPMRSAARRIANEVRPGDATEWVNLLFGAEAEASLLWVEEVKLLDAKPLQVTRIALDQWTQAPIGGALLQEIPVYGGRTTLEFRLERTGDDERDKALAGFFLLIVKELLLGALPIGGTVGVGRGVAVLDPSVASFTIVTRQGTLDSRKDGSTLNDWVKRFWEHVLLRRQQSDEVNS